MAIPRWTKVLGLMISAGILVGGIFLYNVFYGANDFGEGERKVFIVSKGDEWHQIVDSLEAKGIIRNRTWFEWVVRIAGRGTHTQVGKYEFPSGISNMELYNSLRLGNNILPILVTLREGRRAVGFARAFARMLGIDTVRFMDLVQDESFARSLGVEANNLEGYLAPNTYSFNWQSDEAEIIKRLVKQTEAIFDDTLRRRAQELKMSVHEVLTLASIVEGEALIEDERPLISGVYHNRLRKGMKLQADPSIQFIIPDGPRRILFRDLAIQSPYNTYIHDGLPPGPINNPSVASIRAALYPAQHEYLFFVANGKGGHWFSTSYAGHMNYVRRFRRERAEQIKNQEIG